MKAGFSCRFRRDEEGGLGGRVEEGVAGGSCGALLLPVRAKAETNMLHSWAALSSTLKVSNSSSCRFWM